jgi:predicted metalloprotease with PDZ domain
MTMMRTSGAARRAAALALVTATAAACASAATPTPSTANPAPAPAALARQPRPALDISYTLAIADTAGHYYDVRMDVAGALPDTLRLQMPVWSPGRYARMDLARNVRGETVQNANGQAVRFDRENGSLWRIQPAGARHVTLRYQVFANTLSGTFSVLDTAHANWNGASLFMYVVGHKPDPVRLTVVTPAAWHLINGASTTPDQREFTFPDYDHLIDTPTEVARAFDVDSFRVNDRLYRVMVHHNGDEHGQRARFVKDVEKIVRYENTVIGPPPLEMYTFLFNIGYHGSDGMEHLYSTQIQDPRPWSDTATVLPGITSAAHEYFHVWNVKRIRPIALGPFDYTTEQYQPSLWVAEGWTQYYGEIGLLRAGVVDTAWYYRTLGTRIRMNLESPGRKYVSARMASFLAPFWDGGNPPMAVDRSSYFTYYYKGDALALLLDLTIRARTSGARSLDDALRDLKKRSWDAPNASYYLQGRGYTEDDVVAAVSEAAGTDMRAWFDRYVGGTEDPPFAETLALAGLRYDVRGEGDDREYVIEEIPGASVAQLRVRAGWLSGTTTATAAR